MAKFKLRSHSCLSITERLRLDLVLKGYNFLDSIFSHNVLNVENQLFLLLLLRVEVVIAIILPNNISVIFIISLVILSILD